MAASPWPRTWERPTATPAVRSKQTFLSGFVLPFSLIAAGLRHPTLGRAYLRVTVVRVVLMLAIAAAWSQLDASFVGAVDRLQQSHPIEPHAGKTLLWRAGDRMQRYGQSLEDRGRQEMVAPVAGPEVQADPVEAAGYGKRWVLWIVALLSGPEAILVFFSRRWDDWFGFHFSALGRIRPEDDAPKPARVTFDLRWALKKLKNRFQGWLLFALGLPVLCLLRWVPTIGDVLLGCGLTAWGWYWYAVATAGKTAHAWADDATAPAPAFVRGLVNVTRGLGPAAVYARLWKRVSRRVSAPAATFERTPAPFLGLALARVILSLPGLYLFARPVLPIAAGRLCADGDPRDRFSEQAA